APAPFIFLESLNANPRIDAEAFAIATGFVQIVLKLVYELLHNIIRWSPGRHPTVSKFCRSPECRLGSAAEPDRYGPLNRHRIEACVVDHVLRPAIRDQRLSPQLSQYLHLLFDAPSTRTKIFAKRVILDIITSK